MDKTRILITGASGFIGSHIASHALRRGWEVYAGVRSTSSKSLLQDPSIKFFDFDMSRPEALDANLQKVVNEGNAFDYVVHCAGVTRIRTKDEFDKGNAVFTRAFADSLSKTHPNLRKFVFVSSIAALGPGNPDSFAPISEENHAAPITPYGASKLRGEQLLAEMDNFPSVTIRPSAVYGPHDKKFIESVTKLFKAGFDFRLGPAKQKLSFVHVDDLTQVILDACEIDSPHKAFNISDGNAYGQHELNEAIVDILDVRTIKIRMPKPILVSIGYALHGIMSPFGRHVHLNQYKMREVTALNWTIDISRAREALNFSPKYDLYSGLVQALGKTENGIRDIKASSAINP